MKWNDKQQLIGEFTGECIDCQQRLYCTVAASNIGEFMIETLSNLSCYTDFIPSAGLIIKFKGWTSPMSRDLFMTEIRDKHVEVDRAKAISDNLNMNGIAVKLGPYECMCVNNVVEPKEFLLNRLSFLTVAEFVRHAYKYWFNMRPSICENNVSMIFAMGYLTNDIHKIKRSLTYSDCGFSHSLSLIRDGFVESFVKALGVECYTDLLKSEIFDMFHRKEDENEFPGRKNLYKR